MKKLIFVFIVLFLCGNVCLANEITGKGYGKTEDNAKKEALADLSQNIYVEVNSEFSSIETVVNDAFEELKNRVINLKSDLPVLGATYEVMTLREEFFVEAGLSYNSVVLYEAELKNVKKQIDRNLQNLKKKIPNAEKEVLLKGILTNLAQYDRFRIVAQFMQSKNIPDVEITEEEIKNQLNRVLQKADTLDRGLEKIARGIKKKKIYIYPPTTRNSSEITEFASAVKARLSALVNTVASPENAHYYLSGEYQILKNGIELTYHLLDTGRNTVHTVMATFLPAAYKGYDIEPKTTDFDKLLKTGVVISGDLRVDVATSKGKRDLVFYKGERLKMLVKMNRPGYFYVVVHNLKKNEKYSYLIDYYEGKDDRRFIYHVSADEANKWIELGEFDVVPPFGVETLQIIASSEDLINKVPKNNFDYKTELYKIGNNPYESVGMTRGLIRKERKDKHGKNVSFAEATLVFTTLKSK